MSVYWSRHDGPGGLWRDPRPSTRYPNHVHQRSGWLIATEPTAPPPIHTLSERPSNFVIKGNTLKKNIFQSKHETFACPLIIEEHKIFVLSNILQMSLLITKAVSTITISGDSNQLTVSLSSDFVLRKYVNTGENFVFKTIGPDLTCNGVTCMLIFSHLCFANFVILSVTSVHQTESRDFLPAPRLRVHMVEPCIIKPSSVTAYILTPSPSPHTHGLRCSPLIGGRNSQKENNAAPGAPSHVSNQSGGAEGQIIAQF